MARIAQTCLSYHATSDTNSPRAVQTTEPSPQVTQPRISSRVHPQLEESELANTACPNYRGHFVDEPNNGRHHRVPGPLYTNSCQALVEWGHGKTYSPPNRSERRRVGATLPGGQRAARTQLVADPVAAGAWAVGQGHRREHRLLALLDWPDRQALQRRGP